MVVGMSTGDPRCPRCGLYLFPSDTGQPHKCFDVQIEENRFQAEEAECAHMVLDDLGVPKEEEGLKLSLAGRVKALNDTPSIQRQVRAFHEAGNIPVADYPQIPSEDRIRLRVNLVMEEFFEFLLSIFPQLKDDASLHRLRDIVKYIGPHPDLVALADALADLDYVVEGTRLEFGIDGGPVAEEVQRSNMAKFGPGSWMREDGKVMKPPDWAPPDIERVLRKQGWSEPPSVRYPDIICVYCGERNCTRAHVH